MTKKTTLFISLVMLALFISAIFIDSTCNYTVSSLCSRYWEQIREFSEESFISVPLILILAVVYFLRDNIFKAWVKFAFAWVPLAIFFTFVTPEYSQSLLPIEKGVVAGFLSLLFLIISLIIIVWKYLALKSDK